MGKKGGFGDFFFKSLLPVVYSLGAAVVILGAMFKILHLPGAGPMLTLGLSVEAGIFFLSAFEPRHKETEWERVYPELSPNFKGPRRAPQQHAAGPSPTQQLDRAISSAKIGPQLIDSLGKGIHGLAEGAKRLGSLGNAAIATQEYAQNVQRASQALGKMNQSYSTAIGAMSEMSGASKDAKEYHAQVQGVTKNLSALNAVYEMELKDTNTHLKSMNKFYSNVSTAMESISQAARNSDQFRDELSKLTTNISSLNRVYGSMLSAMKS